MKSKDEIQNKYNALIAQMGLTEYEIGRLSAQKSDLKRELDNLAIDFQKLKETEKQDGETASN